MKAQLTKLGGMETTWLSATSKIRAYYKGLDKNPSRDSKICCGTWRHSYG